MLRYFSLLLLTGLINIACAQTDSAFTIRERYIAAFKQIAVEKMKEYKIPASITLAQGVLESGAGRSDLAVYANNHFGIKCHKGWEGDYFIKDDDAKGECFRKYRLAEESFRDHSLFLTSRAHYAPLFKLDILDYKGWAFGLKAAGYATNPSYPQLLIKIIEDHKLYDVDRLALEPAPVLVAEGKATTDTDPAKKTETEQDVDQGFRLQQYATGPADRQIFLLNKLKCVVAKPGDTFTALALDFRLTPSDLLYFNDLYSGYVLKAGDIVFLQKKAKTTDRDFHVVKQGDNLHKISQMYGIRLSLLERRNHISSSEPLSPGTKISLNNRK